MKAYVQRKNPAHVLVAGFALIILVGTWLLMLPASTVAGRISFVDALFTATSAVCVTGLIVKDTAGDFTLFGQLVILALIQVGGFGYMTMATIVMILAGKRIGISDRLVMKEALNTLTMHGLVRFSKRVILFSTTFELVGAVILSIRFAWDMPLIEAIYLGLFHSVSAFNNAGFSLFSDSLSRYVGDFTVNVVICILVVVGGLGFIAIDDVFRFVKHKGHRLMVHSKIVLSFTLALIMLGTVLVFFFEYDNPKSLGQLSLTDSLIASLFASVTARTAGFNTLDYSHLRLETLFLTMILMFIGASPGGTGGGIKTTTFALICSNIYFSLRKQQDTVLFYRRMSLESISKSYIVASLSVIFITIITLLIVRLHDVIYIKALFEVVSAFSTVGLSTGDGGTLSLCAVFSDVGKLLIIVAMFTGRLGPLTVMNAIVTAKESRFRYPEQKITIG